MILDLFAGPGGWDVAARSLGLDALGVENDDAARLTRKAAGLSTVWGDVTTLDMGVLGQLDGLIASPPCQTFSMAGKGAGRRALDEVMQGIEHVAAGRPVPVYDDPRTALVLQPLRYALELEPEWLAWEQVPTVQPVWDACAAVLREDGYHVWTGHLHAEQYGVPQTRKRSVLIASRTRQVGRPTPTHSRFYPRNPGKLDPGVAKWVSMAEALGWDDGRRLAHWRGAGMTERHGERPDRTMDQPAYTMAGLGGSGSGPLRWQLRNNTSADAAVRPVDQPAPMLYFGQRMNGVYWEQVEEQGDDGVWRVYFESEPRENGAPTPGYPADWPHRRPAPTILSGINRSTSELPNGAAGKSIRVSVEEAAVLQSFPVDYPWQGSRTKQFQQVGNAIPPLLALHVLAEATGLALPVDCIADDRASLNVNRDIVFRNNAMKNASVRTLDQPAPTITAGHDSGERVWQIREDAADGAA